MRLKIIQLIFQDWDANKKNIKGRIFLIHFRIATIVSSNIFLKVLFFWYLIIYKILIEWVLGIEIPHNVKIGKNAQLWHGQSTVINPKVTIGDNCVLRHSITIGNKGNSEDCPKIGNNVNIGCNSVIIGNIQIGNNVIIGSGSIVLKDVPSNCIIAGNPAKIIKYNI